MTIDVARLARKFIPVEDPPLDEPPPHDAWPEGADAEPDIAEAPDIFPGDKPMAPKAQNHAPAVLGEWDAGLDDAIPPPRQWLLGNQFCRGFLSGLQAPGATGKTAVRTLQLLALATGRPLTGEHVFKRSRVLLVSLEDGKDELRRRLRAACLHHGIALDELQGWLFCAAPKSIKLAQLKDGAPQAGALEKLLRETIASRNIDLVSLDPFIKLHSLEENDNGAMDFVTDLLVKIAIDCNVGLDAPHHTKKGQLAAGDADAGRGASAHRDGARLLYTLTRMSEDEAKAFGTPAEQRALYVRLDSSKVNIAPPSADATWFKLIGVPLGNETSDYPAGDEVQTVERWHPPKTWDGVSAAQLNAALTDIEAGLPGGRRYSGASAAAADRAAWPLIQRHAPERTEPQCREIIRTWIKNGVLVEEQYDDPIERKPRKGLRVCHDKRPSQ
jgi:hypothetical protein